MANYSLPFGSTILVGISVLVLLTTACGDACGWERRTYELSSIPETTAAKPCIGFIAPRGTGFDVGLEEAECREPAQCAVAPPDYALDLTWYVDVSSGSTATQPTVVPVPIDCYLPGDCNELRRLILSED